MSCTKLAYPLFCSLSKTYHVGFSIFEISSLASTSFASASFSCFSTSSFCFFSSSSPLANSSFDFSILSLAACICFLLEILVFWYVLSCFSISFLATSSLAFPSAICCFPDVIPLFISVMPKTIALLFFSNFLICSSQATFCPFNDAVFRLWYFSI